ncbi:hypothetical protein CLIB1423_24S00980 [[Candida] railenensis]|uniref:SH3 domain-containing protein n=1 Tax=[Candida] railenensis TaxID=45579 RepID=A0A9P0W0S1_9ASCO|nr:hypothetical protein CLIB1423_24S00980 [[Candida] railenensis]
MLENRGPGWQYIKKVLRSSTDAEDKTIDPEFDKMVEEFELVVQQFNVLNLNCKNYVDGVQNLLALGQSIGILIKDLYNPTLKVKDSHFYQQTPVIEEELDLWKEIGAFSDLISNVELSIRDEIEWLQFKCSSTVKEVKLIAQNIASYSMRKRNRAIYELDSSRRKLGQFSSDTQGELSSRQQKVLQHYEEELERNEETYTSINVLLKLELPIFFELVNQVMELFQQVAYYIQLMVVYQFKNNISNETKDLWDLDRKVNVKAFNYQLQAAIDGAKQLKIIKFRDNFFFDSLMSRPANESNRMCEAIFSFEAQNEGDLTIKKGDIISLLDTKTYWYKGTLDGKVGIFPYNYVKFIN